MSWTSLADRISTLPLIICGPILRRVELNSVSVFVVFKQQVSDIELKIYDVLNSNPVLTGVTADSFKLGEYLHVALITAKTVTSTEYLNENTKYYYDIEFKEGNNTSNLRDEIGQYRLSNVLFPGESLPSFVTPPDDINNLRILHTSCRKPHGSEKENMGDALIAASGIIESAISNTNIQRPQHLIMHGDQIYADDVDPVLLYMINDAAKTLMGSNWNEDLFNYQFDVQKPPIEVNFTDKRKINNRISIIDEAGFTAGDYGKNHLVLLAEFFTMYLFVWSDTLWTESGFPTMQMINETSPPGNVISVKEYNKCIKQLTTFRNNIFLYAQKVLANVSCLMMMDDHEITDDVFIDYKWTNNILGLYNENQPFTSGNAVGKAIIRNALTAFAVFQAWGNTPERITSSTLLSGSILWSLKELILNLGFNQQYWNALGHSILPRLTLTTNSDFYILQNPYINWHFKVEYSNYQILFLDTRTNRGYRIIDNKAKYPALLSPVALVNQINNTYKDEGGSNTRNNNLKLTIVVAPCPVFGMPNIDSLQTIAKWFGFNRRYDFEPWKADPLAFEAFIKELVDFKRVAILSGDVHFACTLEVGYWDERSTTKRLRLIQSTASASKNNNDGLMNHLYRYANNYSNSELIFEYVGWDYTSSYPIVEYILNQFNTSESKLKKIRIPYTLNILNNVWHTFLTNPDYRYRIKLRADYREFEERALIKNPNESTNRLSKKAQRQLQKTKWFNQKILVHMHNIGDLHFYWDDQSANEELHMLTLKSNLWYNPAESSSTADFKPYTLHEGNLKQPAATEIKPGNES